MEHQLKQHPENFQKRLLRIAEQHQEATKAGPAQNVNIVEPCQHYLNNKTLPTHWKMAAKFMQLQGIPVTKAKQAFSAQLRAADPFLEQNYKKPALCHPLNLQFWEGERRKKIRKEGVKSHSDLRYVAFVKQCPPQHCECTKDTDICRCKVPNYEHNYLLSQRRQYTDSAPHTTPRWKQIRKSKSPNKYVYPYTIFKEITAKRCARWWYGQEAVVAR